MALLAVIPNRAGPVRVALTTPCAGLCPVSGEPREGSTLTLRYQPAAVLIGLDAVALWLGTQTREALDLETLVQRLAHDAAAAAGMAVEAEGAFVLRDGISMTVTAWSDPN